MATEPPHVLIGGLWPDIGEGVGINDLTATIGIAAPSLYDAFRSKADLFRVLRRYGAGGMGPDDVARSASGRKAARRLLEQGVAAVTKAGGPFGCMMSSGLLMTSPENAALAAELRARGLRRGRRFGIVSHETWKKRPCRR